MLKNHLSPRDTSIPVLLAVCALLCIGTPSAAAQSATSQSVATQTPAAPPLPDAPQAQSAPPTGIPAVPWIAHRRYVPGKPLTAEQKFSLYAHQNFGPPAFVTPAFGAAVRMANPPSHYPRDWKDGSGAFGRLYGSTLATQTTKHTAEFVTEAAFHYDPRYAPSSSTRTLPRIAHALEYVVVEKTDSGATEFALPHFAGSAAGGFVGMAYLPPGYDDLTHAGQRAGTELLSIGMQNIASEFSPELAPLFAKLHIPRIIPVWWTPLHRPEPAKP